MKHKILNELTPNERKEIKDKAGDEFNPASFEELAHEYNTSEKVIERIVQR